MASRTITLVATLARLDADHPVGTPHHNRTWKSTEGIMSARYAVDPVDCTTKLGAWLAERIGSTRHDDDASRLSLVTSSTEGDLILADLVDRLDLARPSSGNGRYVETLAKLAAEVTRLQSRVRMDGAAGYDQLRVTAYDWPVYGSRRCAATTVSEYFDWCGTDIRRSGAVIMAAGLDDAALPEGLAASMAGGRGLELLRRAFANRPVPDTAHYDSESTSTHDAEAGLAEAAGAAPRF